MSVETGVQTAPERISAMIEDLPAESVTLVEQFVRLLRQQAKKSRAVQPAAGREERPPYLYPTVALPASSLNNWLDLVPEGYEGDALTDTESLYDEAIYAGSH